MKCTAVLLAALVLGPTSGCAKKKGLSQIERDMTRSATEWLEQEPVRALRDYVRLETTEKNGEREGAEYLQRFFECAGISSEIVCPQPARCNLLARLPGRRRGGALLLLNHIDVMPAFPQFWREGPPFEGRIKKGYLYGRGTYDMKSIAIAQAFALRSLKRQGIVPDSDVLFLAEADEEMGQRWGARWLLENRPEWFSEVTVVLNEGGTNETVLRDVRYWGLETLQAGVAWAEFQADSEEPLKDLARRWSRLEDSRAFAPHPHVVEGFDLMANHLQSPLTDPLRHLDRVRQSTAELEVLPNRYRAFLEPRVAWSPVVIFPPPPESGKPHAVVVVTAPPGVGPGAYLSPILDSLPRAVRVVQSFRGEPTTASPYRTPDGELVPFVALLKRVTEARHPGVPFGPIPTSSGYTTSVLFRDRGFAAYGYSPFSTNIFDAVRRHGNDERVFLRDFLDGISLYTEILEEFALNSHGSASRRENSLSRRERGGVRGKRERQSCRDSQEVSAELANNRH